MTRRALHALFLAAWFGSQPALSSSAAEDPAPLAIDSLLQRDYPSTLTIREKLGDFSGYSSYAVNFESDGLRQSAVMNVPATPPPKNGYPVLIMGHGNAGTDQDAFKPLYSKEQDSASYRQLTAHIPIVRFAREGFVVFYPDYRGYGYSENQSLRVSAWPPADFQPGLARRERLLDSDGLPFNGWLYTAYYTIDILHLISAVRETNATDLPAFEREAIFLWGHSLGGDVMARTLTISDHIKAASLWAPATTSLWDQAHHYHYDSPCCADGRSLNALLAELQHYNQISPGKLRATQLNPGNYIGEVSSPVMLQVTANDTGVRSAWAIEYHYALREFGVPTELKVYPGEEHVFSGDTLEKAIQADLEFFQSAMKHAGSDIQGQ